MWVVSNTFPTITDIPRRILAYTMGFLLPEDVKNLSLTCKTLEEAVRKCCTCFRTHADFTNFTTYSEQLSVKYFKQLLKRHPKITKLRISEPVLRVCHFKRLAKTYANKELSLRVSILGCFGMGSIRKGLPALVKLSSVNLELCGAEVIRACLPTLEGLPIRNLSLRMAYIEEEEFAFLQKLPLVESLTIEGCSKIIEGKELLNLSRQSKLQSLKLKFWYFCNTEVLSTITSLERLTSLDLSGCSKITTFGPNKIQAPLLRSLNLASCDGVTDSLLEEIEELDLTVLSLWRCQKITPIGVAHLVNMPLERVDLGQCSKINDFALLWLSLKNRNLKQLELEWTGINRSGFESLQNQNSLTELNLNGCTKVHPDNIRQLASLPIRKLHIDRVPISASDARALFPRAKILTKPENTDKWSSL